MGRAGGAYTIGTRSDGLALVHGPSMAKLRNSKVAVSCAENRVHRAPTRLGWKWSQRGGRATPVPTISLARSATASEKAERSVSRANRGKTVPGSLTPGYTSRSVIVTVRRAVRSVGVSREKNV